MKTITLTALVLIINITRLKASEILTWEGLVRAETCRVEGADEPKITRGDFRWHLTLQEIQELADNLYTSGKRLAWRAHVVDQDQVVVPRKNLQNIPQNVLLTPTFIMSVRRHIEEALRLGYVNQIIFSDMGHSHFYIPQQFYDEVLSNIPIADSHLLYQKMMAHPELKILYHTAEQLNMIEDGKLVDDRLVQWRFYTRNLMGDNQGQGKLELIHQASSSHNTARGPIANFRYWGAGFYVSASQNGCFPYTHNNQTYYFDINLHGLEN